MRKGFLHLELILLLVVLVVVVHVVAFAHHPSHQKNDDENAPKHPQKWIRRFPWNKHRDNAILHRRGKQGNESDVKKLDEQPAVKLSGGYVRGGWNKPAHVFRGIPMAEPPVGELRYRKLRPLKPWKRIVNATRYAHACPSNTSQTTSPQSYIGEDCIYMNVFADPSCKRRRNPCPVLFYVHGGGFYYDSAVMFNDTQIVSKYASDGVVFLIPAYRLGVFGFLDLGSDSTVPRNLGLHDIIFALQWAKREVHAFGGDPRHITIMGNSGGASAVECLLVSPAVDSKDFKQAIISSGTPSFSRNLNVLQTLAILEHFNCLNDSRTNKSLSDWQKVECLRNVTAEDLINAQRELEDTTGMSFTGPESDTVLLPGESYAQLLPQQKPLTLLITTTREEMHRLDETVEEECLKLETIFGYSSAEVNQACLDRYNSPNISKRMGAESMHAPSLFVGIVNKRRGGKTYMGSFRLENHTGHADDLLFFFGLHMKQNISWSPAEKLMDLYYPSMIKRFLRDGVPDKAWRPIDAEGRNYFVIDFNVSANGSVTDYPHPVNGQVDDPAAAEFWLLEAAALEHGIPVSPIHCSGCGNHTQGSNASATHCQGCGNQTQGSNATYCPGCDDDHHMRAMMKKRRREKEEKWNKKQVWKAHEKHKRWWDRPEKEEEPNGEEEKNDESTKWREGHGSNRPFLLDYLFINTELPMAAKEEKLASNISSFTPSLAVESVEAIEMEELLSEDDEGFSTATLYLTFTMTILVILVAVIAVASRMRFQRRNGGYATQEEPREATSETAKILVGGRKIYM